MITHLLAEVAGRPLHWLGIDAGRTVSNAEPNSSQARIDRVEQFAFIAARLAGTDDRLAIVTRGGAGSSDDEVSVMVFEDDRLVARLTSLDTSLRESIPHVATR